MFLVMTLRQLLFKTKKNSVTLKVMPLGKFKILACRPQVNLRSIGNVGFTMVELLVAIGIIALLSAIAIPNLRDFNKSQEVDGAAFQFANVLRTAQSSAASHIKCPNQETSLNWSVRLTGGDYRLYCTGTTDQNVFIRGYAPTATGQVTFLATNDRCIAGENLSFYFTNQQVSYLCGSSVGSVWPVTVTISNSGGSISKKVVVDSGGIINVQ